MSDAIDTAFQLAEKYYAEVSGSTVNITVIATNENNQVVSYTSGNVQYVPPAKGSVIPIAKFSATLNQLFSDRFVNLDVPPPGQLGEGHKQPFYVDNSDPLTITLNSLKALTVQSVKWNFENTIELQANAVGVFVGTQGSDSYMLTIGQPQPAGTLK